MDVAIDVEGESLSSSSLVLSTASPFLHSLLSSLNHCHGCSQRKTIVLPEENKGTVRELLDRLHAKYLKIPRLGQTDSGEEQIDVRNLAEVKFQLPKDLVLELTGKHFSCSEYNSL